MMMKRAVTHLELSMFWHDFPIYVNRVSEGFTTFEHTHNFFEITYVAEGQGIHYINDEILPVSKGDLFWIPIGTSHVFRPSSTNKRKPLIVYNCIFTENAFASPSNLETDKLFQYFSNLKTWKHMRELNHEFSARFNELNQEFSGDRSFNHLSLHCDWLQLLIMMNRRLESNAIQKLRRIDLEPLLGYISEHPEEKVSLQRAAEMIHLSERQLQRLFIKRTGQSFISFVQGAKIQKCCDLLLNTDLSVSAIYRSLGFQDQKHFYSVFKRKTGQSPGQYRKNSLLKYT